MTRLNLHAYGCVPDKKDARDFLYRSIRPRVALPASVDLRSECSPVRDQGQLGCCTGFALATGMREFLESIAHPAPPMIQMSPMFVYWEERKMEHDVNRDAGGQIRDGMNVLASMGCAPESDDPYNVALFKNKPSCAAKKDAGHHKISTYHRLLDLTDMQACLASGYGFAMGFTVYESFESDAVAQTGIVPMPASGEQVVGGHAVFCVGYKSGYLIVKNSWGTGWGDSGFFYLPFAYVTPDLVSDVWVGYA